ncbi:MAG: thioredoxin domain-containing protein [Halofilum sp. (in: g-proteobacteria)]
MSRQSHNEDAHGAGAHARGSRYIYAAAGAIALAAVIVMTLALTWPTDPPSRDTPSTQRDTRDDGTAPASGDTEVAQSQARSGQSQNGGKPQFPARLDRLGVSRGDADAPVIVREFSDYQCPFCKRFFPAVQQLVDDYVTSGQVRFVYFDFPLSNAHQHAVAAAQAARCAGRQDQYWAMHDTLFERQDDWSEHNDPLPRFRAYARELGLDAASLARCVREDETLDAVQQSRQLGARIGVRSTPSILVGTQAFSGAITYERLRQAVERELAAREDSA